MHAVPLHITRAPIGAPKYPHNGNATRFNAPTKARQSTTATKQKEIACKEWPLLTNGERGSGTIIPQRDSIETKSKKGHRIAFKMYKEEIWTAKQK